MRKPKGKKKPIKQGKLKAGKEAFPIVGIGASAGGIEAVSELLRNLPSNTGMAYVYVQHLDPSRESMLTSILSKATAMDVVEAKSLMRTKPNTVFVIPPNKNMIVIDGSLKLNPRPPHPIGPHLPINDFFVSLAERRKEGAIGIILSGNGNDGSLGLKSIKIAGGLTFAQDETARFQGMPNSAVAEGVVDLVLSPREIAAELERLSKQTDVLHTVMDDNHESELPETDGEEITSFLNLLRKSTGVDFFQYKRNTIKRRIIRRMLLNQLKSLKEYSQYVRDHAGEVDALYQDLLIHVTSFFRDTDAIEYFRKSILPKITNAKGDGDPLRVWIPACSTGQEAYSIAMVLMESPGIKTKKIPIQIFATDLSEVSISRARMAIYSASEVAEVSPQRLQRFFTKVDGSYRIVKTIRDLCVFARHNIFKDPPFSRIDAISCCNLLIYLEPILQRKLFATFHYALNPVGYLILGKSEATGTSTNLFTQIDKKFKIYQRKKDSSAKALLEMNYQPEKTKAVPVPKENRANGESGRVISLETIVDKILLNRYVPPSVVINEDLEIIQFRGATGLFLEPAPGKASLNLLKMARQGLAFELKNLIRKAKQTNEAAKKAGIELRYKGNALRIDIEAVPLKSVGSEKYFLLVVNETGPLSRPSARISRDKRIRQLDNELSNAREDMYTMVEEQSAVNELLQNANEEVVSSNEELQSINEELETSKEEVESTNEELLTINSEMQVRNDQLSESNEYAEAIIGTIREAALVLDSNFCIKTASKSFYRTFNLTEEDVEERSIFEIGNGQWDIPWLHEFLNKVISSKSQFTGAELTHFFRGVGEKVLLINGRSVVQKTHRRQFLLLAIEDITEHETARKIIAGREMWFRDMANNAPVMIWTATAERTWNFFNKTWCDFTGQSADSRTFWGDLIHPDDRLNALKSHEIAFESRGAIHLEYRLRRYDMEYRWVLTMVKPNFASSGEFEGFIGTLVDIHDRKLFLEHLEAKVKERTQELELANRSLEDSNEELRQFAYVASHDLQEPLRKIQTFSNLVNTLSREKKPEGVSVYLDKISESSQRMSKLIDDLLNLSRSTRLNQKFIKVNLNNVVDIVLDDFDLNSSPPVKIKVGKLAEIEGIEVQLSQLFHNLISNAIKFTATVADPVVEITCRKLKKDEVPADLPDGRKYFEIAVRDNGIGFDAQYAEQIFVIFQRLHDRQTFPGTGIGLALCKKIVSNHGGHLYAESTPGQGATFNVILPEVQSVAGDQ